METTEEYLIAIRSAADYIRTHLGEPEVAITLGSGLGTFVQGMRNVKSCAMSDIPHFPQTSVQGHASTVLVGDIGARKVLCFSGRIHGYEGGPLYMLSFALRVAAAAGCKLYVCTNAAGGSMPGMTPNCVTVLTDCINFARNSYLSEVAPDPRLGAAHPDTSALFDLSHLDVIRSLAKENQISLFEGVYGGTPGPAFETPSEVRAFTLMGAGVFGMSTVAEAEAAAAVGLPVIGLSLVSNLAAGCSVVGTTLSHDEVMESGLVAMSRFRPFVESIIEKVPLGDPRPSESSASQSSPVSVPLAPLCCDPPTLDQAAFVAAKIQSLFGDVVLHGSVFVDTSVLNVNQTSGLVVPRVPLVDIMADGASSVAARAGSVFVESRSESNVLVVYSASLNRNEYALLVSALRILGLSTVGSVIAGVPSADLPTGARYIISSAASPPLHVPRRTPVHHASDSSSFLKAPVVSNDVSVGYLAVAGPEPPCTAERAMAAKLNFAISGISSLGAVHAAADAGLSTFALAITVEQIGQQSNSTVVSEAIDVALRSIPKVQTTKIPFTAVRPPTVHTPSRPLQTPLAHVEEAAEAIRSQWKLTSYPLVAVAVPSRLKSVILPEIANQQMIKAADIPHFPPHLDADAGLILGQINGEQVLVVVGMSDVRDSDRLSESTFLTRVVNQLGVFAHVLLNESVSTNGAAAVGQLVTFADHINMYGRTPLTGPNQAAYGPRFVDMSAVYDLALRGVLKGLDALEGIAALLPLSNEGERSFAKGLGADFITSSVVPETHVARQADRAIVSLGIVRDDLESPALQSASNLVAALKAIVPEAKATAALAQAAYIATKKEEPTVTTAHQVLQHAK